MSRKFKLGALSMVAAILGVTAVGFAQPANADNWHHWNRRHYARYQNRAFLNNGFYNSYYGATVHPNMYNVYPNYGYGYGYAPYGGYYNRGSGVVGGLLNMLF